MQRSLTTNAAVKYSFIVATRKPKRKITPVEAQRRRLEALTRWFDFIKGKLVVSPEQFDDTLLLPTFWSLGGSGSGYSLTGSTIGQGADGRWRGLPSAEQVEEVKRLIMDGLTKLVDERMWIVSLAELEISVTPHGTSYKGARSTLSQLGVAQLLRTEEWRADRCAWCGDLFLKKKRGEYCSLRCSQRMRTKRARDPVWRKIDAKARKLGFTIEEYRTAENRPCPKCGAKNLTPQKQLIVGCRKCGALFGKKQLPTPMGESR